MSMSRGSVNSIVSHRSRFQSRSGFDQLVRRLRFEQINFSSAVDKYSGFNQLPSALYIRQ